MSALFVRYGKRKWPLSPVPTAIVRKPLRFTLTGTAWSASVISTASDVNGPTRTTCPTTPCASISAWPTNTSSTSPRFKSSRCRYGSRSTERISATSARLPTRAVESSSSRRRAFSRSSTSSRWSRASVSRRSRRNSRFSAISASRSANVSRSECHMLNGRSTATRTGYTTTDSAWRTRTRCCSRRSSSISAMQTMASNRKRAPMENPLLPRPTLVLPGALMRLASCALVRRVATPRRRPTVRIRRGARARGRRLGRRT